MSSVINTNVMSLNAQRNLTASGADLATSMQRLSSGLRINSAKDDAAGLAISQRMTAQIRGLDQAARNANDGISLVQTAEGALSAIGDNLQRIRELAVQSANATNSQSDRAALDLEAQALKDEIDRVAGSTKFNDVNLLDGSFTAKLFQVGANQGETIEIASIANASSVALGSRTTVSAVATTSAAVGTITPGSIAGTTTTDYSYALQVDGLDLFTKTVASGATATSIVTGAELDTAWATFATANTGYTLTGTFAGGTAVISKTDGSDLVISQNSSGGAGGTVTAPAYGASFLGTASNGVEGTIQTGFADLDISDVPGANDAILAMDAALTAVNSARANLGAIQNRFTSVVSNLSTTSENLSTARSRIQDTDYAKESAQLTRNQILQQAGTAMLAQANQSTQSVLKLIS